MADLIQTNTVGEAWLAAMELMLSRDGKAINLSVAFPAAASEEISLREEIDAFVEERNLRYQDGNLLTVGTVANTIFPDALYHPHLGKDAAPRLYENYALSMRMHRRRKNDKETYFNRLIAYPVAPDTDDPKKLLNADGSWNQLDYYVQRLASQRKKGHLSSSYELGVSHPQDVELRVQTPFRDKRVTSFPCLSHISLTLVDDHVHMNATYRNQTFVTRAFGNYLGLARLLRFIATETGAQPGEVQVVATHADTETSELGSSEVRKLVERCRTLMDVAAADKEATRV